MVNPLRGEASFVAGDETYRLVFDVNAFCLAERALGLTTDEVVAAIDAGRADLTFRRALLWAGLQKHHDCHLDEVGDIMSTASVAVANTAVMAGLAAAFGVAVEGKKRPNPPKRKAAGTG